MGKPDLDHHASQKMRLTGRSALELLAAAALAVAGVLLLISSYLSLRYRLAIGTALRDGAGYATAAEAERAAATAIGFKGNSPAAWAVLGQSRLYQANFEGAEEAYVRLGQLAPHWPEYGVGHSAVHLNNPATREAAVGAAQSLLNASAAGGDATAVAALGQLALDAGDIEGARSRFAAALQAGEIGDDLGPTAWACAVAYNGLGICRLMETPWDKLPPEDALRAAESFERAEAYLRPWSPPTVNADRAYALWLVRVAATGGDTMAALDHLEASGRYGDMDVNGQESVVNQLCRYISLPGDPPSVPLPDPDGATVTFGGFDITPLHSNRYLTVMTAIGVAKSHRAASGQVTAHGLQHTIRQAIDHFDRASANTGSFASSTRDLSGDRSLVPAWNAACAMIRGLRVCLLEPTDASVVSMVPVEERTAIARNRSEFAEDALWILEWFRQHPAEIPPDQRAALLMAWFVAFSQGHEALPESNLRSPDEAVDFLMQQDVLGDLATAPGAGHPGPRWLAFMRYHLESVRTFAELSSVDWTYQQAEAAYAQAAHFAAHYPAGVERPAPELASPSGIDAPGAPLLGRDLCLAEGLLLTRAWQTILREADAQLARIEEGPREANAQELRIRIGNVRLLMAEYFAQRNAEFRRGTSGADLARQVRQSIRNAESRLAELNE